MAYNNAEMTETPLRIARKKKKLSLQTVAAELGVSVGQMSRIERHGTTDLRHALKLAERFKIAPRDLAPQDVEAA